jgi:hypothetical protein
MARLASSGSPVVPSFNLNCLVLDDDPRHVFLVEIAQTKAVDDLKRLIKERKQHAFDGVDADRLNLWDVSVLTPTI